MRVQVYMYLCFAFSKNAVFRAEMYFAFYNCVQEVHRVGSETKRSILVCTDPVFLYYSGRTFDCYSDLMLKNQIFASLNF